LCVLFWSGNVLTARALHDDIGPFTLSFWRWTAAFVVLLPWAARGLRASWASVRTHWRSLAAAGILGMGAYSSLVYLGLQSTTATNAALINAALPVVIAGLGSLLRHQRLSRLQWSGVATSLAGVILLVLHSGPPAGGLGQINTGDLWVLAAVVCFAIYTLYCRRPDAVIALPAYLAVTVAVAAIANAPLCLWEAVARDTRISGALLGGVAYLAVFPSILSYAFWNRGVDVVGAARAGAVLNLMPVFTAGLAVVFLDEALNRYHAAGAALILTGIVMTARGRKGRAIERGR
jgi:drug/metabolite transporter (DMT)-like permease